MEGKRNLPDVVGWGLVRKPVARRPKAMEPTQKTRGSSLSREVDRRSTAFAVCVDNTGYPASLEAGKLYEVVPDPEAAKHGLIRVIDESGEDYGYSAERFFILAVPHALEKALKVISATRQPDNALQPTARRAPKARSRSLARKERVLGGG